ncbi:hypothetical protein AURDEDRAFT_115590 [Auricularia subglabra TFB-10046 SS5]|nr:hypothetical protein AURDEDRAFT_115590 [Auricularia subglabra TFB-10046 SS5]
MQTLQSRLEQCFRLTAASYIIQYKDDDNEISQIVTEGDLTDAIVYFDAPLPVSETSSAPRNSMGSFDSWTQRKVTMYIDVIPDDDGTLSDLWSLDGSRRSVSSRPASQRSSLMSNGRSERLYPLGTWTHLDAIAERGRSEGSTPQGSDHMRNAEAEYRADVARVLQRAEALEAAARMMRDHVERDDRDWVHGMAYSELGEEVINFVAAARYEESLAGSTGSQPHARSRSSHSR